jgi:hypothetical protein
MTAPRKCSGTTLIVGDTKRRVCKCHWWELVVPATETRAAS